MGFFDAFVPVRPVAVTAATNDIDASLAPLYPEASPFFAITGTSASRAEAMTVPTIARSLGIIQTVASLPMHCRNIATGEKVQSPRVINQPDTRIAGSVFWAWMISDLFFHPTAYARVTDRYADTGRIRAMERIAPERVSIQTNQNGTEVTAYLIDGVYVDPNFLVVFAGESEGLLARAGRTIKAAAALEKSAMNFANEPIPQMILKSNGTSLPADRVAKLLNSWRTARSNKSTAFLNADVSIETLGFDPKSIQLNEASVGRVLRLSDQSGRELLRRDLAVGEDQIRLDLANFAAGFYLVQLQGAGGINTQKLVITK